MTEQGPSPGKLELRLLGSTEITVDDARIDDRLWTRRKSKSLVKILALAPRHQVSREQLMELLWPELDPDLSANNLNKIIHAARRTLEPELKSGAESRFIVTIEQQVGLRAPGGLWIDAEEFETIALTALKGDSVADVDRALSLYRGDLLEEDRYEEWTQTRRAHLKRLYERLLAHAGQLDEAQGKMLQSIDRWSRLLAVDNCNEDAHRQLMRLYALTGSRHLAVQQFEQCKETISRELDAEPEAATVALHRQILSGEFDAPRVSQETKAKSLFAAEKPAEHFARPLSSTSLSHRTTFIAGGAAVIFLLAVVAAFIESRNVRRIEAIAVLPFVNATGQADLDYLSDGVTESLINSLSHLSRLRVLARTTSFRYRGREADPVKVGTELNVNAILAGRLDHRGDEVAIQADLIDVRDGSQIWGHRYNRKLADIASVQSEIAKDISDHLKVELTSDEESLVGRQHTTNPTAYQQYLLGRYYWNKRTAAGVKKAVESYQQAIAADPKYALAYAGLADAYAVWPDDTMSRRETARKVKEAAVTALNLDERTAEAHTSLAFASMIEDRDLARAEASFKRSIELNPNYPTAHHWYAYDLAAEGRIGEAIASIKRALELDPVSLSINADLGEFYFLARRFQDAERQCRHTLDLDSGFGPAHQNLGLALAHSQKYDEAIAELKRAAELSEHNTYVTALSGYVLAMAGKQAEARSVLKELASTSRYVSPFHLALIHAQLGERDKAFELLERANEERVFSMLLLRIDPRVDSLRNDPRFEALLPRLPNT